MLFTVNILPLVLMYFLLARLVERFGTTDWGRMFVMAVATLGTLLTTFAVVLNNHLVAAVSATIALYAFVRIYCDGERRWWLFCARRDSRPHSRRPTNCPPSRCWPRWGLLLLLRTPRETLLAFAPAALDRRGGVLRHELSGPRQLAAAVRAPQRDQSGRQLVRLLVHGQRRRAAKLLARPPGHRPRRADAAHVRGARARRPSRHFFAHAGVAAEHVGHIALASSPATFHGAIWRR